MNYEQKAQELLDIFSDCDKEKAKDCVLAAVNMAIAQADDYNKKAYWINVKKVVESH